MPCVENVSVKKRPPPKIPLLLLAKFAPENDCPDLWWSQFFFKKTFVYAIFCFINIYLYVCV